MRLILFIFLFCFCEASFSLEDLVDCQPSNKKSIVSSPKKNSSDDSVDCLPSVSRSIKNGLWKCMEGLTVFLAVQSCVKPVSAYRNQHFDFHGEMGVGRELSVMFNQNCKLFYNVLESPSVSQKVGHYLIQLDGNAIPFVDFDEGYKKEFYNHKIEWPYFDYDDILDNIRCCEDWECEGHTKKNITLSSAKRPDSLGYLGRKKKHTDVIQADIDFIPDNEGFTCSSIKMARFYLKYKKKMR